jgi:hypothetical protein
MAYQGSGSHSPSYDDAHDLHDAHHLQNVPGSQVREIEGIRHDIGLLIRVFLSSTARMKMPRVDCCPNTKARLQLPLMIHTPGAFLPSVLLPVIV